MPIQKTAWSRKEQWCSSSFANTEKHGIHKLIVMGQIAQNCVEATVRYAAELGYKVTVVKDATASYSDEPHARCSRSHSPKLRQCHCDHR